MFSSYARKVLNAKADSPAYPSAFKNAYAWEKVVQGLGMESYKDAKGETIILTEQISRLRKLMVRFYGESFAIVR
jgi:hypothetical protein